MVATPKRPLMTGEPSCSINDGRETIGLIFDRGKGCIATLPDRVPLGRCKDWKEARQTIYEARRSPEREGHRP